MTVNDDVPGVIRALLPAIDSEGRNLDAFAAQALEVALGYWTGKASWSTSRAWTG